MGWILWHNPPVTTSPLASYVFTVVNTDGVAYSFTAEHTEELVGRYQVSESGNRVEYRHAPPGRNIP